MDGFNLTRFGCQPERFGRDLQELCGIAEVEPRFSAVLGRLEHGDAVVRAHRRHAFAGPPIAVARLKTIAVEQAGDQIVACDQHQLTHRFDDVGGRTVALSTPALGQAHLAVGAADPVNDEDDLGRHIIDIGHDLMDESAHDALLQPRIGRRCRPDGS
jgi:hypothetical protein